MVRFLAARLAHTVSTVVWAIAPHINDHYLVGLVSPLWNTTNLTYLQTPQWSTVWLVKNHIIVYFIGKGFSIFHYNLGELCFAHPQLGYLV